MILRTKGETRTLFFFHVANSEQEDFREITQLLHTVHTLRHTIHYKQTTIIVFAFVMMFYIWVYDMCYYVCLYARTDRCII